jgi:hypothetical protein
LTQRAESRRRERTSPRERANIDKEARQEIRGKRQEARGKRQETRGKGQEARGKRQEARAKRQEASCIVVSTMHLSQRACQKRQGGKHGAK